MKAITMMIDAGFEIYPVDPVKKSPFVKYTKTPGITSKSELQNLWIKGSKCYATVPERNNYIVIDIDRHGTINGFNELKNKNIQLPQNIVYAQTPGKGCHLYFKYTGKPVLNNTILPGVEVKYSNLVTIAGSIDHRGCYILSRDIIQATNLPHDIQKLLILRERKAVTGEYKEYKTDIDLNKISNVLNKQGHSPVPGNRNRYSFEFAKFAAKTGKTESETINYLVNIIPDYSKHEIISTVKSAYSYRGPK